MHEPNPSPESIPVRRKDREVTDEAWIDEMLTRSAVGILAMVRDGEPAVNMNIFVYAAAERCIYLHTAHTGHTRESVEASPRVSFCVSEMGRLLPAMYAKNFSVEYASVVAHGVAEIVTDEAEAGRALQLLMDKYAPHLRVGTHYRAVQGYEVQQTTVYRIRIDRWSAKRKVAPADHPGAFLYGESAAPPWDDWTKQEAPK
jgi:uncharacterized protein